MKLPVPVFLTIMFLSWQQFAMTRSAANQVNNLNKLIKSRKSENPPNSEPWPDLEDVAVENLPQVYVGPQEGLMEADKIDSLPGQPVGVDFDQYAGYVTVDPEAGRALFYYFVESPQNCCNKPLVLWLSGGPACSSLGFGAMEELGPFRVKSDRKTLYQNNYSWNQVANVIFLESPAGVGFSYYNSSKSFQPGDRITAVDSYTFLVNWFERFPQYKNRDFYITGESYAGHYVPQLAYTILAMKERSTETFINLKGIAIGNALVDTIDYYRGKYDYYWTHALNSDEIHSKIDKSCDYRSGIYSPACKTYMDQANKETGSINLYNIYAPPCKPGEPSDSVKNFDGCTPIYVSTYLNQPEVQLALHARLNTSWQYCSGAQWTDMPDTILPVIKQLMNYGIRIWLYSGDVDSELSITATKYSINRLNIPIETAWRPWYSDNEVGGYVVGYKGLALVTVRGAGHEVPSYQPERALTMISSFLQGKLPPPRRAVIASVITLPIL